MKLPYPSRLAHQLGLGYGVVLALLLALLVTALFTQQQLVNRMRHTLEADGVKAEKVVDVTQHVYASALSMRNLSVINNPSELGDEYTRLVAHIKAYEDAFADFTALLSQSGGSDEEQAQLAKVRDAAAAAREIMKLATASAQGSAADDFAIGIRTELRRDLTRWNGALGQWIASMNALRQIEVNRTKASVVAMNSEVTTSRVALISMAAAALLMGLFAAWSVTRSVSGGVSTAVVAANRIASGDLAHPVEVVGRGEIAELLGALKGMQNGLVAVVSTVRQGSEGVATASTEIAQGNHDLSNRTEQQASVLEETTASMEDLSTNVRHNADSAAQANQLAMSASSVATRGGEVVGRVVETMKGINESSRKISDIISVIDGIAFQTNILALNAAVEAARAGEQGRGFAVVASEVRSLAGRSAEAAKEIKSLINASVGRVEQGTALVDQAGTTMTEVVSAIRRVTDIMGEITAASHEQSSGVSQMGQAIAQMDRVTQQNAALVEQMAAAASSLKAQAQDLVGTVAVFKLSPGAAQRVGEHQPQFMPALPSFSTAPSTSSIVQT